SSSTTLSLRFFEMSRAPLRLFSVLFGFFLYRYGHPRDLHSFPTRRSSDLPSPPPNPRQTPWQAQQPLLLPVATSCRPIGLHVLRDRKSTRLNSSHVKISYAVFCLKKKKKYSP